MGEHSGAESQTAHPITDADRCDLLALLDMRFGAVPQEVLAAIAAIEDVSQIDHLILVAANAASWADFIREVREPGFRIVGQGFDPLPENDGDTAKRGHHHGE